jgi:hypothetical protein
MSGGQPERRRNNVFAYQWANAVMNSDYAVSVDFMQSVFHRLESRCAAGLEIDRMLKAILRA